MPPLQSILSKYLLASRFQKEKGAYFDEFIRTYFRNEPRFTDPYSDVWFFLGRTRMMTVSLETMKIVKGLPELEIP